MSFKYVFKSIYIYIYTYDVGKIKCIRDQYIVKIDFRVKTKC